MSGKSAEELLAQVRETAEGFEVFGELGRRSDIDVWFLARDQSGGGLVALRLKQDRVENGEPVFGLEIAKELDHGVALGEGRCPTCRARLRDFARFCSRCGCDLAGSGGAVKTAADRAALLEEVRIASAEHFEVLGQMPWSGGVGMVYFAIERASGRLTRLRLKDEAGDLSLDETDAAMTLKTRMSATYTTSPAPAIKESKVIPAPPPPRPAVQAPPAVARPAPVSRPAVVARLDGAHLGWIVAGVVFVVAVAVILVLLKRA